MKGFILSEIGFFSMLGSIKSAAVQRISDTCNFSSASSVRGESLVATQPAQITFRTSSLRGPQVKAEQCNSKDRYYDEVIGDCKRCSKCCGDDQDVIKEECERKMGAASNMLCSFESSVNQCDRDTDTLTPSPQETTASQTKANASASPENTTESKNASTAASLDKTTASQKDRATESPKVTTVVQSTPFPAHFTQNVTGTFTSSGEKRSLKDSSKAKLADNQVGLIVGITVAVVLVLVIWGALISYCLLSKSCSCTKDPEKGVYNSVNDTAPCPVAIKGDPHTREKKPWKVKWTQSKSESIDPLCEKNPEGLVCTTQPAQITFRTSSLRGLQVKAEQCNSKDRYYDEVIGDCKRCSKCCGDDQDVIKEECERKMGAASNMLCSFESSVNQCDRDTDTLTPSPQETTASQTKANASASPENTTESKNASTAASLDKTTASQKDRATESPKVTTVVQSTPFPAHFTQNVTGTFTSSGEKRSLKDSSKAKLADNQVGLIVGITVAVVLVLVIWGALISYCLLSKSCSCTKDPEKGVYNSVNDTAPCPVAIKGDPHTREKKPWKVKWTQSKSESIDPLCKKNPEGLVCACQTSTQKEPKLLGSLLSQESTLRAVCEMLDTFVRLGGDYRAVAKYYGFNYYQISSVLGQATYPGEPTKTRALIWSLASSRPNLTVREFANVVERNAKRKDVSRLLRAYDMAEEATEEE